MTHQPVPIPTNNADRIRYGREIGKRPLTEENYDAETYLLFEHDLSREEVRKFMEERDDVVDWNAQIACYGSNAHLQLAGPPALYALLRNKPIVLEALWQRGADFNRPCYKAFGAPAQVDLSPIAVAVLLDPRYRYSRDEVDFCLEELVRGGADPCVDADSFFSAAFRQRFGNPFQDVDDGPGRMARFKKAKEMYKMYRDWPWVVFWSRRVIRNNTNDAQLLCVIQDQLPTVQSYHQNRFDLQNNARIENTKRWRGLAKLILERLFGSDGTRQILSFEMKGIMNDAVFCRS